jgi:hypothetical protein
VKEKAGLCTDFAPSCLTYLLLWGSPCHFQNYPSGPCFRCQLLPFTCRTWVTGAIKDEGTTESCSIAPLMKHTTAFIKSFLQRAFGQKKRAKYYMLRLP